MSSPTASNYVLGQSVHEYERLMLQARILRPYTEKFFRAAGLAPGMRVLEVGSGMGDVALLSGDIVGPGGRVLGIDRDATALDNARRRTDEQGCSSWVEFRASDLDEFTTTDQFDAFTALTSWVEKGSAPESIVATAGQNSPWPGRSRPLCAYPKQARYKSSGSIEDASNFVCQ